MSACPFSISIAACVPFQHKDIHENIGGKDNISLTHRQYMINSSKTHPKDCDETLLMSNCLRLLIMILMMFLIICIYALNRKARPGGAGVYFRLSICFSLENHAMICNSESQRAKWEDMAYFREAIPRLLLFVLLSFGAYDSQPYKVITQLSVYEIYLRFMQNATATWQSVWSVCECIYLFSLQTFDSCN